MEPGDGIYCMCVTSISTGCGTSQANPIWCGSVSVSRFAEFPTGRYLHPNYIRYRQTQENYVLIPHLTLFSFSESWIHAFTCDPTSSLVQKSLCGCHRGIKAWLRALDVEGYCGGLPPFQRVADG